MMGTDERSVGKVSLGRVSAGVGILSTAWKRTRNKAGEYSGVSRRTGGGQEHYGGLRPCQPQGKTLEKPISSNCTQG